MASYRKLKKSAKKEGKFAALAAALAAPAIGSAAPAATQSLTMPVGIPGVSLKTITREVPADEPPVLATNDKLSVLGKRTRRLDAHLKVTGQAKYTYDVNLPGMLFARMHRSPHPHATVKGVDTSAAERYPGVKAVYIIETVVGSAIERDPNHKNPKVQPTGGKFPKVRYAGQPIAAVAATTQQAADEAARLIEVDYELLPFVTDLEAAMKPDAPLVYGGNQVSMQESGGGGGAAGGLPQKGNVRGPSTKSMFGGARGNVEKGFKEAEIIVEGEFKTQVQTHAPLETHGMVADYRPDGLTVYLSTQDTAGARSEMAELFKLPKTQVRVITEFMGGGFGAKYGAGNYGVAATNLSKKTGVPVRLMLDRREEHVAVGNRPNSVQILRIGAKKDGTLTAMQLVSHGTAGVGLGAGVGWIAETMYLTNPNFKGEQYDVLTNAGPGAAFRAPGAPQGAFALEQLIDELAEKVGIDALALRDKIDKSEMRREQRRVGAERFGWSKRQAPGASPGVVKRGVGAAQSEWGRFVDMDSSCEVRLHQDGSVEIMSSVQDLGTGIRTVLAQVVAEELGLQPADITVRIGDTNYPAGPGSGGSKTTGSITPPARTAAYKVGQQLLAAVAPTLGAATTELAFVGGKIVVKNNPGKSISFREAARKLPTAQIAATEKRKDDYGGFFKPGTSFGQSGGIQFVEVAVDTETGYVKVERVVGAHDCGRPLNPLALESQINGGILQGISWALYENRHLDRNHGHMMNANLDQYKILGSREVPQIDIIMVEEYTATSSTDALGIAESANVATAAAVANAVYNAIGVRIRELPITPQRVLNALAESKQKFGKV